MAVLTTDQLDLLRDAHYEGAAYLIAGPQNIVFAARVNGTPAGNDFAQINYDTVTVGAYTDIRVDQDIRISRTNDVRKAFFYGRIRKSPTASILYINETSAAIEDNFYIFVVNSYPLVTRQRYKTFVDWDKTHTPPPPIESNVDSAYVGTTTASTATFSLESIPQAIAKSATITGVEWTIPDATYTVGTSTDEEITFTVDTPYNEWAHLEITDSNGTTNTLHFTITAGDPHNLDHDFFRLCHDDVPISADWDNGYSASTSYWAEIDDLLDRTRITLVSVETFDGEALEVSNIQFVGYLDTSNSNTAGDEVHGQSKDVQIELSGLMQLTGKLRFNQIAIRHSASPTAWDFINTPTPVRNIVHLFAQHSTFLNLCSLDFQGLGETFLTGNVNVEETSLTDAARKVAREINGYLVQSPAGKITLIRDPRVGSDAYRATIPDKTPTPIDLGDVYSYKLTHQPYDRVGWMDVGFLVMHPTAFTPTFITANAPASGPGDGQEDNTNPSQLLASTSNLNTALSEARQRTGDLYALANARRVLEVNFGSGWGPVVRPTPGEYYQFSIDSSDDVRGYGIDSADNWLCLSVNMTINRNGTQDTIGTFAEVTQGGNALISASISPSVVNTPIPVLPVISPYPAFAMPASINYDTTTPTNKIPRDPFSGMQTLPLTTEEAAAAAQNQPNPGESRAFTYFSYASNVTMDFTTVLDEAYTIVASGSAKIASDAWEEVINFTTSDGGFTSFGSFTSGNGGTWTNGVGWESAHGVSSGNSYRMVQIGLAIDPSTITYMSVTYNVTNGTQSPGGLPLIVATDIASLNETATPPPDGMGSFSGSGNQTGVELLTLRVQSGWIPASVADPGGSVTVTGLMIRGTGTNPFTASPGTGDLYADALYTWNLDDEGKPINVAAHSGRGLYIDNAAIGGTLPPFNENSTYTLDFVGTGNPIQFKFEDDDYSDNERLPLNIVATGPGAGS